MPKKRLTQTNVTTLPTKSLPYQVWDYGTEAAQGLGVLVSPNGVRTYRAIYYYPGSSKPLAIKLGRVGEMSLDNARERTREIRGLARRGLDPKKGDPARSSNFKSAVEHWTEKEQVGRKQVRSSEQTMNFLLGSTRAWHARPVASIRKGEIEELLDTKRDQAAYAANRLHAHLSTFFKWCLRTERISINPMAAMPRPWDGAKPRDREWFKNEAADQVVQGLWKLADEIGGHDERFIKLLVITGKRRNAIETMLWEHVDRTWWWTPPPGSKSKRCHPIPLPKLAQRLLGKHQKVGLVVGRPSSGLKAVVRRELDLPDFIFHGVRHIVETKLGELKVPFHIRDLLLDHAPMRGAGRGYDHHSYKDEMLEALERWSSHIEALVAPKGVKRLR